MTNLISLLLFSLSAVFYCISQLQHQGKLRWSKSADGFWGNESDKRKYKRPLKPAPLTAYYKYNDLTYVEAFPGSGSIGVFLTDGYHFCQFLMKLGISAAIGIQHDRFWVWSTGAWLAWSVVFKATLWLIAKG